MGPSAHRLCSRIVGRGLWRRINAVGTMVLCAQEAMVSTTRLVVWPRLDCHFYLLRGCRCVGVASRRDACAATLLHIAVCAERGL